MFKNKKTKKGCGDSGLPPKERPESLRKRSLWTFAFILLAVLTVWAITSQTKNFSFDAFFGFLGNLHFGWVAAALVAMLLYIFFEGYALVIICRGLGSPRSIHAGFSYSAADIYFSAITPSATGGQPASAFLMVRDGMPVSTVTVALLINLVMYTFSIIILGIVAFIVAPSVFLNFTLAGKILILVGIAMQLGLAMIFILLLRRASILRFLGNKLLSLLARLHLVPRAEKKRKKLNTIIDSYEECVSTLGHQWKVFLKALLCNILQRGMLIAIALFSFLAAGGAVSRSLEVWSAECMVVLGSNYIPIPGAMGVADGLMLDIFSELFGDGVLAANLELLTRFISFYLCVILCGIFFVIRCAQHSLREKRCKEDSEEDQKSE